jgi:hypothetical protein
MATSSSSDDNGEAEFQLLMATIKAIRKDDLDEYLRLHPRTSLTSKAIDLHIGMASNFASERIFNYILDHCFDLLPNDFHLDFLVRYSMKKYNNKYSALDKYIQRKGGIHTITEYQFEGLFMHYDFQIIRFLVKKGYRFQKRAGSILRNFILHGGLHQQHYDLIELFLKHGYKPNKYQLYINNRNKLDHKLHSDKEPYSDDAWGRHGVPEHVCDPNVNYDAEKFAEIPACMTKRLILNRLVYFLAIDKDKATFESRQMYYKIVKLLLQYGADPNEKDNYRGVVDGLDEEHSQYCNKSSIELTADSVILEMFHEYNQLNDSHPLAITASGETNLMMAMQLGYRGIVKKYAKILQTTCNIDWLHQDNNGDTILHLAFNGSLTIVKYLSQTISMSSIDMNSIWNIPNNDNVTPYILLASKKSNKRIRQIIMDINFKDNKSYISLVVRDVIDYLQRFL